MDLRVVTNSWYICNFIYLLFTIYVRTYRTSFTKGRKEEKRGETCFVCISFATLKRVGKLEVRTKEKEKEIFTKNFDLIYS